MFFLKSAADEDPCKALYSGQSIVQKILIVLAILCIPTMLLGKPIILYLRNKRQSQVNFEFFRCCEYGKGFNRSGNGCRTQGI